jgi:hypothetical protein
MSLHRRRVIAGAASVVLAPRNDRHHGAYVANLNTIAKEPPPRRRKVALLRGPLRGRILRSRVQNVRGSVALVESDIEVLIRRLKARHPRGDYLPANVRPEAPTVDPWFPDVSYAGVQRRGGGDKTVQSGSLNHWSLLPELGAFWLSPPWYSLPWGGDARRRKGKGSG